jgi:hypothetical protein
VRCPTADRLASFGLDILENFAVLELGEDKFQNFQRSVAPLGAILFTMYLLAVFVGFGWGR